MFWRKKEAEKKVEEKVEEKSKEEKGQPGAETVDVAEGLAELKKKLAEEKKQGKGKKPVMVYELTGSPLWMYMVQKHGLTGEQLMPLVQVRADGVVEGKPATLVRIFEWPEGVKKGATVIKGVTVEDYHSLDNHPELILYEGYYTGSPRKPDIHIEKKNEWVPR